MADQTSLRNHVAELESQVQLMMELLGQAPEFPSVALFPLVDTLHSRVETLQKAVGEWPNMLDKRVTSAIEEASILTDAVDVRVDGVQAEVNLLKRVVGQDEDRAPMSKVKVPDPKPFGGARSAKELENFLWDMETYFQAAHIPEVEKVSITSMYLNGDAKLWWRTRLSDDASTVRDYVKEFSSLMLDVRDMSEEDKLFNFLSGLQTWAHTELRRQGVKDLSSAIAAADRLVDIRVANSYDPEKEKKDSGKEKGKSGKGWKDGKFKKKKNQEVTRLGNKETVQPNVDRTKKGCYLCNGDHRMRDCPKRRKLNALVAEVDDDEGGSTRVNPLQLMSKMQERPPKQKGLMYMRVQINGKAHSSRIKALNSKAKPIQGVACVELKVSAWTGKCNLMVVPLDDFDVILGMDFILLANAMVIPYLSGLFIADQNSTCFVQVTYLQDFVRSAKKKDSLISAMQVKAGLRHGEQTYLAALIEIKSDVVQEVPDEVGELLQEFKDVFPPELPKKLPPRRAIDHAIKLEPGARPPTQSPYRMAPAELAELRKQLDGLLEAGLV
ncbi:hypothetical protein Sango_1257600 [Sesamum angolense]|uniref:Retrotransposon gag domain-containing protein n=1 Tax=Sesamum angolense TaxID=2727404 RepID=A0AAE2BU38_9LAMI|nr:hypothetical protein Sango_1257600 [Sesamum angolense]